MRLLPASLALLATCAAATAVHAATVATPVATVRVTLGDANPVLLLPAFDPNSGRFGGSFLLCDGSVVLGATACSSAPPPAPRRPSPSSSSR